jgi:hypothetical protein
VSPGAELAEPRLDDTLRPHHRDRALGIGAGTGDEHEMRHCSRRERLGEVDAVACLALGSRPVSGAAGDDGVHSAGSDLQTVGSSKLGPDDLCPAPGEAGRGRPLRPTRHRGDAMAPREEQIDDAAEPPRRPGDQHRDSARLSNERRLTRGQSGVSAPTDTS